MAVGNGKGGNKGKPITYTAKPAVMSMGSPFRHESGKPTPITGGWTLIRLREKYRR